jgi:hypothetical protein
MKRFLDFIKQSFNSLKAILNPREWTITIVSVILSTTIATSVFWLDKDDPNAQMPFESIGYSLKVKTETGVNQLPFHTYYQLFYEKVNSVDERASARQIFEQMVPPLHKVSDRSNRYLLDDDDPSLGRITTIRDVNESLGSGQWIEVPEPLYELLQIGKQLTIATDSNFNMFIGKPADYWKDLIEDDAFSYDYELLDPYYNDSERAYLETIMSYVPITEAEVEATLELKIEAERYYAKLNSFNGALVGDMELTMGGLAKGYANDVISTTLAEQELVRGFINGGQSSISTLGNRYGNIAWPLTMASPLYGTSSSFTISRPGRFSVSTSGGYEGKPIMIDEQVVWRHHIIDPWTGYPSSESLLVNVMSQDLSSATLDALSTALMNLTIEEGMALRDTFIANGQELEIAWVEITATSKLNISYSRGFDPFMQRNPENFYNIID